MNSPQLVPGTKLGAPLNDLFGIFFEDINHAADGGLYAEMVQNRSFEFAPIDNETYQPTTAWKLSDPASLKVTDKDSLNIKNRHYLEVNAQQDVDITNLGFNRGMYIEAGKRYHFSFFVKTLNGRKNVNVHLTDKVGNDVAVPTVISVESHQWLKYTADLDGNQTTTEGRLTLKFEQGTHLLVDMISLFPDDTFNHRPNYVRKDLGETLKALHPKFLRFPGGCLVHDGQLDPDDRGSMYRWKNSIGPVEQRPARRNNWGYNQTLGLGYFEYFELSEDIGAKPLPVLPGGYDPHHDREAPIDQLGEWIDDALDLIEFANGSTATKWGKIRANLGHPKPFNLEYLAIGNEEVGQAFFDRYPYFHKAIKAKYPEIKLINTAGPFAAGKEFDRGWKSAQDNHSDLVDEHYYMDPEWFLANQHRYDSYDPNGPKAFLGEYASKANQWYNAVVEASYMIGLERNADKVGLACYAPLFCNVDYENWGTDLIYFDQKEVSPTVNYFVQQLFMKYQGTDNVYYQLKDLPKAKVVDDQPIVGKFFIQGDKARAKFENIVLDDGHQKQKFGSQTVDHEEKIELGSTDASDYTITFDVTKTDQDSKGTHFCFGQQESDKWFVWILGGWANTDSMVRVHHGKADSDWTQTTWSMAKGRTYHCKLVVDDRRVQTFIDGQLFNDVVIASTVIEPVYTNMTYDRNTKQYYFKVVNVTKQPRAITVDSDQFSNGSVYQLSGHPDAENKLGTNNQITTNRQPFNGQKLTLPPYSVTVLISPHRLDQTK